MSGYIIYPLSYASTIHVTHSAASTTALKLVYLSGNQLRVIDGEEIQVVTVPAALLTPSLSTVYLFKSGDDFNCLNEWQENSRWIASLLVKDSQLLPFWYTNGKVILQKPLEVFSHLPLQNSELRYVNVPTGRPVLSRLQFHLGIYNWEDPDAAPFLKVRIHHGLNLYSTPPINSLEPEGLTDFTAAVDATNFGGAPHVYEVERVTDAQGRLQFQRRGSYYPNSGSSAYLLSYQVLDHL